MKSYLYQEVYGHKEITEWVPADVARELFEITKAVAHVGLDFGYGPFELSEEHIKKSRELLEKLENNQ